MLKNLIQQAKKELNPTPKKPKPSESALSGQDSKSKAAENLLIALETNWTANQKAWVAPDLQEVTYFGNFLTPRELAILDTWLESIPDSQWVHLDHAKRRLLKLGGDVTFEGLQNPQALPSCLSALVIRLWELKLTSLPCNHILLNDYPLGSGIMPHTDGPLYYPSVFVLSLWSTSILQFFNDFAAYKQGKPLLSILVEPNSFYTFAGRAYNQTLHCIPDQAIDQINCHAIFGSDGCIAGISHCSVANLETTNLWKKLKNTRVPFSCPEFEMQMIAGSDEFNVAVFIRRGRRVSLTIRAVPEAPLPQPHG